MVVKPVGRVLLLVLLLCCLLVPMGSQAAKAEEAVTILFTHDMHSHLLPSVDETGRSYGGYARLQSAIDRQRIQHPDALLVDGGDFSMGTLFQAAYATDATELRVMGAMGYDVTTFGNHDFDYRDTGLAKMLNAALDSGEPLPALVDANYKPPLPGDPTYGPGSAEAWAAWERYGIRDYTVIQRGGVNFAVFGLMGRDSHACAPMSGMVFQDPVETAAEVVARIEAEVPAPRVVVCLSHSGTNPDQDKSEDTQLAKNVEGIDVILSAHTHTTLTEPLQVNGTYIVSAGEYCRNLGVLTLNRTEEGLSLADYQLIPIDDSLPEDPDIAAKVEGYKTLVEESYLRRFGGLTFDQVLAVNPYPFESLKSMKEHHEAPLGNLIADAYLQAVKDVEGEDYIPVDFALTANGIIRDTLPVGDVTVANVFSISSLGIGPDEVPGYPLVSVWITGKELKNAFEVDASITGLMPAAQLYFKGMEFSMNPHRMLLNRVMDCAQVLEDGTRVPIQDDKLYRVVTGLYCGQMLGEVESKSFGILQIIPRDAQGEPIADLEAFILRDQEGNEVKEWYALATYLQEMGTVSDQYSGPEGRKVIDNSWNPVHLLSNLNGFSMALLAVVLVIFVSGTLVIRHVIRRKKRNT